MAKWGLILMNWAILALVAAAFLLGGGCATSSIRDCQNSPGLEDCKQSEDREYRRQVDAHNWDQCAALYKVHRTATFHRDHTHSSGRVREWDVKTDLMDNNCRQLLGDSYLNY
jgi:hypothetical protein